MISRFIRLLRGIVALLISAITISFGLLTLVGLLGGESSGVIYQISLTFLQIASITVAITVIIGIYNLVNVHARRVITRKHGMLYSAVMLASFILVIFLWLTDRNDVNLVLLDSVQVPIEAGLAALVLFALVYGAYRLMRRGVTWTGLLFTVVLLIVLLGALPTEPNALREIRAWLLEVPVNAGQRGILLGIALATLITGIRVITGQDRSIRE